MKKLVYLLSTILLLSIFNSCSTDIAVNAPPKDIWVVYGVLDKLDSVQYIRVMKAFLKEGNAIEYASQNDISAKGLTLTLKGGNNTYTATEVAVPLTPGAFYPSAVAYKFKTVGSNGLPNLKEKEKYELTITDPNRPDLQFTAYTIIPQRPTITDPVPFANASATERCVPEVSWYQESNVYFKRQYTAPGQASTMYGIGYGFEFRMYVTYQKNGVSISDTVFYPMFQASDPCNGAGDNLLCLNFGKKELLNQMKGKIKDSTSLLVIKNEPKCVPITPGDIIKDIQYEVTALDTFLTNYLIVNNPANAGFATADQTIKYTNWVSNNNSKYEVYGILGSINKGNTYVQLDDCTLYQLHFNNTQKPETKCD